MTQQYFALSLSQKNILNQELKFNNSPINNICTTLNIKGRVDFKLLETTLNIILENDDSLRTRFAANDGIKQYIQPYHYHQFPIYDFTLTNQEGIDQWTQTISKEIMVLYDTQMYAFYLYKTEEMQGGILIKTHHLISDGYTQVLLCNKIAELYLDKINDVPSKVDTCFIYQNHIEKEQNYLNSKNYLKDKAYWTDKATDFPDAVSMKDFNSAASTYIGNRLSFSMSEKQNHLIYQYCLEKRVSPFSLFYMILAIWLKRARNVDTFTLGVPIINRNDYQDKNTSGMFVSTLPFVGTIDENWSINEFNDHLMEDWLDLLKHQRFPFEDIYKLVKQTKPEITELFHLVLSYQNSLAYQVDSTQVFFDGRWNYSGYQGQHLCIHVSNRMDLQQYTVDYDYLVQVFSQKEINELHQMLMIILEDALTNQNKPIWALKFLNDKTENDVLYHYSYNKNIFISQTSMKRTLVQLAEKESRKIALIYRGNRISYHDLIYKAYALSLIFKAQGQNQVIALLMPREPSLLISLLAVVFSDNTWLIIDTKLPKERIIDIIKDSKTSVVITDKNIDDYQLDLIIIDYPEVINLENNIELSDDNLDRLAYLVYTSGTSGKPKGVRILEKSLVNFARASKSLYGHGAVLSICNIGFDAFILETIVSLLNGQTIVLAEDEKLNNPTYLVTLMNNHAIGFMAMTPSRLAAYMQNKVFLKALSRIETIVCGGEIFPSELLQKIKCYSNTRIINQYGPSEATIGVSYKELNNAHAISVGKPMIGCRLYVLDQHLLPLPKGAIGEVYIGGLCLADGYQNNVVETNLLFGDNPYESQEKLYRSKDSGYWNDEGDLIIVGRKDNQIKLHGYRIELQEIAAKIINYPNITDATAISSIIKDKTIIIAYFISDMSISELKLREHLSSYLPYYMIPNYLIQVDQIPLTINGKVDIDKLPKPQMIKENALPTSRLQMDLLQLFTENLHQKELSVNSDYFLSGGDSLTAIELLTMIEEKYQIQLTILELYTLKTVKAIAEKMGDNTIQRKEINLNKTKIYDFYPLTPIQKNIYVLQNMHNDTAYNMPGIMRFTSKIDVPRLEKAFNLVLKSEPILRSAFVIENNELLSRIKDCSISISKSQKKSLEEALTEFIRPFDLAIPPLMRVELYQGTEDEALLLDMHHIVMDGVSTPLLLKRLKEAYETTLLPDVTINYLDYAWSLSENDAEVINKQRDYWKKQIQTIPKPFVIDVNPYQEQKIDQAGRKSFKMGKELSELVKITAQKQTITPFMLLLAAFSLMLQRLSKQDEICIGTVSAGRNHPHTQNMIGVFINTLPLVIKFQENNTINDLLSDCKDQVLALLANQDISQEEIINALHITRDTSGHSLYNVLFSMRPFTNARISLDQAEVSLESVLNNNLKMDLALEICPNDEEYSIQFEYNQRIFTNDLISYYNQIYQNVINLICQNQQKKCIELNITPLAEKIRLIDKPNYLRTPYNIQFIDRLIDQTAALNPHKAAIIFHDESITYKQLIDKANQLAALLINQGIKCNDCVAIALDRGYELLIALLAIMKSGGTYLPLDLDFPDERLQYMLANSDCQMIITKDNKLTNHQIGGYPILNYDDETIYPYYELTTRQPNDNMYVLYTSGSTGKPKGVILPHKALANLFSSMAFLYDKIENPILCSTNPVFDVFISESLFALASNNTVIMADQKEMLLPWELARLITKYQVNLVQFTPSRCRFNLSNDSFKIALANVKFMILVGEALTLSLLKKIQSTGKIKILNFYGPTEAAVYVSHVDLSDVDAVTIGKPLANCRIYVMNDKLQILPPTVAGELYLAGECLAKGYINQPELTAKAFIDDPLFIGEKMYRTGDLGYLDLNGDFVYINRIDSQIKLNGHRIEVQEINEIILKNNYAAEVITLPIIVDDTIQHLHTFVVSTKSIEEIKTLLKDQLPAYMVPSYITKVDKIPLNANGKADLKLLTKPNEYVTPKNQIKTEVNDIRQIIINIWKDAIKTDTINLHDSFFDQGGTSLGALIVLSAYYNNGWTLTMKDFYDHPTIEKQYLLITKEEIKDQQMDYQDYRTFVPQSILNTKNTNAILLTGASGYLGAYLLYYLLKQKKCDIYCLVRDPQKLKTNLNYYFGEDFYQINKTKIIMIKGDITKNMLGLSTSMYHYLTVNIDEIMHSAANVNHYSQDDSILNTNLHGTINILNLAKEANAFLHYISTVGITGDKLPKNKIQKKQYTEKMFDVGQNWSDNIYTKSKFLAEEQIYQAINQGFGAHVYRVGHLVGRSTDGLFQINPGSNEVYRIMQGIKQLNAVPMIMSNMVLELTPIDECAKAIITLMKANETTYHVYNPNYLTILDCFPKLALINEATLQESIKDLAVDEHPFIPDVIATCNRLRSLTDHLELNADKTIERLKNANFSWSKLNIDRLLK